MPASPNSTPAAPAGGARSLRRARAGSVRARHALCVFLEEVLRAEREARWGRAREMVERVSGFPAVKMLEGDDVSFSPGAPRAQIQALASLAFVEPAQNVVSPSPRPSARRIRRSRSATRHLNSSGNVRGAP